VKGVEKPRTMLITMTHTVGVGGHEVTDLDRLKALRAQLRLELSGIRSTKGKSAYAILKCDFDMKGSRKDMLAQVEDMVREQERR